MAKMKLTVAVIESHANGDEGINYINMVLDQPKGLSSDDKQEWLNRQAKILKAFIKNALLERGYDLKER
jgi:hypothetical protein